MKSLLSVPAAAVLAVALPAATALAQPAAPITGETSYANNCAACHQPAGAGIGPFPPLAANKLVTGPPDVLATTVLMGRGGMPAFKSELGDEEMAALLTYIRGAWGNGAAPVTAADMAGFRAKAAAEAQPKDLQAH